MEPVVATGGNGSRDPPFPSQPLELALERIARVLLGGEPATLDALRVTPADPVAVRPQPRARGSAPRILSAKALAALSGLTDP